MPGWHQPAGRAAARDIRLLLAGEHTSEVQLVAGRGWSERPAYGKVHLGKLVWHVPAKLILAGINAGVVDGEAVTEPQEGFTELAAMCELIKEMTPSQTRLLVHMSGPGCANGGEPQRLRRSARRKAGTWDWMHFKDADQLIREAASGFGSWYASVEVECVLWNVYAGVGMTSTREIRQHLDIALGAWARDASLADLFLEAVPNLGYGQAARMAEALA